MKNKYLVSLNTAANWGIKYCKFLDGHQQWTCLLNKTYFLPILMIILPLKWFYQKRYKNESLGRYLVIHFKINSVNSSFYWHNRIVIILLLCDIVTQSKQIILLVYTFKYYDVILTRRWIIIIIKLLIGRN